MKELKKVQMTYMEGNNPIHIQFTNVKYVNTTERFLEIRFNNSELFTLKLENLVYYSIK